ncbi:modular serine protease-like [Ctenocephalides felis]|uniref:modular serine protease-like n=1 Tax=Ctenocephalides felis TaxID=7515 RepID=UPI000E6E29C3|nr:modular serine protease-like [Ctenocephalides felis]
MNYIWITLLIATFKHYAESLSLVDEISNGTLSRLRRQEPCPLNRWPCGGGSNQCIDNYEVCDGRINCRNRADETAAVCSNIRCPSYAHRCAYGACVRNDVRCNGVQDCADGSDETLPECNNANVPGVVNTPSSGCKRSEFRCKNGQCISRTMTCDGSPDCTDASDETSEECSSAQCYPYVYRCDYGACVSMESKCNGIRECYDGSDEDPRICGGSRPVYQTTSTTTARPTSSGGDNGGCTVPDTANVITTNAKTDQVISRNQKVSLYTVAKFRCRGELVNGGASMATCYENGWDSLPECTKSCNLHDRSETYELECYLNERKINCTNNVVPAGTIVKTKCIDGYKVNAPYTEKTCLSNGHFDIANFYPCVPICGLPIPKGVPYIVNGFVSKTGEFPWHAAIYWKENKLEQKQICGGSIINAVTILSAAHCFYITEDGRETQLSKENYAVGVGKINRFYNANERQAQFSEIAQLIVHSSYQGVLQNYAHDIAILKLETPIRFSMYVAPVCMDWDVSAYEVADGDMGKVAGWGLTEEHGEPSEWLQWITLPKVSKEDCLRESPHDFQPFIVDDKFCAGYLNGSSVCRGDSGGGLSFQVQDKGKLYYFLKGIVSVGPNSNGTCNSHKYTAFTSIKKNIPWLKSQKANLGLQ